MVETTVTCKTCGIRNDGQRAQALEEIEKEPQEKFQLWTFKELMTPQQKYKHCKGGLLKPACPNLFTGRQDMFGYNEYCRVLVTQKNCTCSLGEKFLDANFHCPINKF